MYRICFLFIFMLKSSHSLELNDDFNQNIWNVTINLADSKIFMDETEMIGFNLTGPFNDNNYFLTIKSTNPNLLIVGFDKILINGSKEVFNGFFNLTGIFLGKTEIVFEITSQNKSLWEQKVLINIIRRQRTIDTIFTASVAILVSLIYINFGCALNWTDVKTTLRRPIGPIIGLSSQFFFMPLASYVLGLILFPDDVGLRLGMFFTGVAPGGGASNMWTVILNGNLHLSITMTTISTIAAFVMMPLWVFTLGKTIFHSGKIPIPYAQISTYAIALVVPLLIGYLIQKYLRNVGQFLAKMLKGFASVLLIFIIVFAIVVNLYLFKLFSWELVIAGMGLPWLGYAFAWIFSRFVCRQNPKDSLTIAIETGIQNTGIAIFLLRFTLPQPEADITTIAPVAVATMTPIPLFLIYIIQKIKNRRQPEEHVNGKPPEDNVAPNYQSITS
ncbi:sodium/bile acid cotransporter 5 [Onthophagus taurus]|uniref:sodium/bile acid cotransporter 5 n=1 Tax=Onthophagus taurus TaxID=166361 RepID=UPI0039BDC704